MVDCAWSLARWPLTRPSPSPLKTPQVQLTFRFQRANREEIMQCNEELKSLQERIAILNKQVRPITPTLTPLLTLLTPGRG